MLDYSGAFNIIRDSLSSVGSRATHVSNEFINLSLVLTFGGEDCPGGWETLGSVPPLTGMLLSWNHIEHNGAIRPRSVRFVDDTGLISAM